MWLKNTFFDATNVPTVNVEIFLAMQKKNGMNILNVKIVAKPQKINRQNVAR